MKLDSRTLRLIAIGASVSANCQPCLEANRTQALEEGLDLREITEAIQVGQMVRRGAANKMDKFTAGLGQAEAIPVGQEEPTHPSPNGCGCH